MICAEGLHFSAFHYFYVVFYVHVVKTKPTLLIQIPAHRTQIAMRGQRVALLVLVSAVLGIEALEGGVAVSQPVGHYLYKMLYYV